MRLLVCGSRHLTEKHGERVLEEIRKRAPDVILHGAANGADMLADHAASHVNAEVVAFPANWKKHGRRAGPIRNEAMLRIGKPDAVLAFKLMGVDARGTSDMICRARDANVPVDLIVLDP